MPHSFFPTKRQQPSGFSLPASLRLTHALLAICLAGSFGTASLALAQTGPEKANASSETSNESSNESSKPPIKVITAKEFNLSDTEMNRMLDGVQVRARKRNMSPQELEKFYEKLITEQPTNAKELANFADFMEDIRKNYPRAEELYEQALALAPQDADILGEFAVFLSDIRENHARAEQMFERAITADPKNARNLGSFARFMKKIRKNPDRAEKLYERAVAADPHSAKQLSSFATFLETTRNDNARAEKLYEQALVAGPTYFANLANFAMFMQNVRKNYPRAEKLFQQALAVDPADADNLNNFAIFTATIRKDNDAADKLFERALAAEPGHNASIVNWAQIKLLKGDQAGGKAMLERLFATKGISDGAALEAWFYRLIHFPADYPQAKNELLALLKAGVRDQGWDFSGNIALAEKNQHPNLALVKAMEQVILDNAKLETLTPYLN
jgi:Tfp pilus assembly protein PilF